jgi:nucleoid DNA-binding protein/phage tail protein X
MNNKLSFADIVDLFASKTGQTKKDAEAFLRELLDVMSSKINEEELLKIRDFGTFKVVEVESRESVDVNTGEKIVINSHKKITFVPDKTLKELVNKPFSLFNPELLNEGTDFENTEADSISFEDETEIDNDELEKELATLETQSVGNEFRWNMQKLPDEEIRYTIDLTNKQDENQEQSTAPQQALDKEESYVDSANTPGVWVQPLVNSKQDDPVSGISPDQDKSYTDNKPNNTKTTFTMKRFLNLAITILIIVGIVWIAYLVILDKQSSAQINSIANNANPEAVSENKNGSETRPDDSARSKSLRDSIAAITAAAKESAKEYSLKKAAVAEDKPVAAVVAESKSVKPSTEKNSTEKPSAGKPSAQKTPVEKTPAEKPSTTNTSNSTTDVTSNGATFRTLALKHYGSKEFWVYIYQANKGKVPNPNMLHAGIKVVIPDAASLGIDANNPASVQKAIRLGTQVLNGQH